MTERIGSKHKWSPAVLLMVLFGLFIVMFLATSAIVLMINSLGLDYRTSTLLSSVVQALLAFIVPSIIVARMQTRNVCDELTLNRWPGWVLIAMIVGLYIFSMVPLNNIIEWNERLTLPGAMSAIEQQMRAMENAAKALTDALMADTSVWGLISGVLVIGCLTGLAEEMFFRGGIQRLLHGLMNRHIAVWVTAFIFSFMHFQFFGFVPRMLMGAIFGYYFLYSGRLWTAVIAHALNNSMVVISVWLSNNGYWSIDVDKLGTTHGFWSMTCLVSVLAFVYLFKDFVKITKKKGYGTTNV